jgi:hypothetical protein
MKPTAPPRNPSSVIAVTPWTSSRLPAAVVRFASSRSHTPAVLFFQRLPWLISFSLDVETFFDRALNMRIGTLKCEYCRSY